MKIMMKALEGKKTYLVAVASFVYALVVLGWGMGDWMGAGEIMLAGLGLGALRNGIN